MPADLATCPACLDELRDGGDRRHRYPFINCTGCGPRYSIAIDVPYDRARTTMRVFDMCAPCASEYADPLSRRFHAQPNACADCGPRLWAEDASGASFGEPLGAAVAALRRGAVVAVKGIAGFHLACDARDAAAVARLRERKRRPDKPFAVMFPDLAALEAETAVDTAARAALVSPRRPIVPLPHRAPSGLAAGIAPRLAEVGAFLPYTPVHHLLLEGFGGPLVMTSGNLSEEPIAAGNDDARRRLAGIADLWLLHDRDIHARADDSVVRVMLGQERVLRRSRGHVPEPIALGFAAPPILAVGADLKNAPCLTFGDAAVLGPHVGDLESLESQEFFEEVRAHLERLFRVAPACVAHDLHPGYHSTALARRTGLPLVGVQHHHAHIASCLVDNGRTDRVIGVAWDGTGYGPDGTVWGGEFLAADLASFERLGRIRPVPLAGGDAAAREPWRMAFAHATAAGLDVEPLARAVDPKRRQAVLEMIRTGVHAVPTSSAGRLFDALASLMGVRDAVSYEGQAAAELEALAEDVEVDGYPLRMDEGDLVELDPAPLIAAVVAEVRRGEEAGRISARVHAGLAAAIVAVCGRLRTRTGLGTVALSGGCFQNHRLTVLATSGLRTAGFEVLLHSRVPPSDGGIALGQAAVAAWRAGARA